MDNQLLNQTLGAIISIVQILLPLGSAFYGFYKVGGVKFIKSKIGLISDSRTRDLVNAGFDRIVDLLDTEITNAESTAKPLILQKIAEGQLNKDSLKDIGVEVAKSVMSQLPEKTINLLQQEVNDVSVYVNKKLEQRLDKLKQDSNSGVSKTILPEVITPIVDTTELENKNIELTNKNSTLSDEVNDLQNANLQLTQNSEQVQTEKDNLLAQVNQLQAKLDTINNAIATANISNNVTVGGIIVNSNDATNLVNNITDITSQSFTMQ